MRSRERNFVPSALSHVPPMSYGASEGASSPDSPAAATSGDSAGEPLPFDNIISGAKAFLGIDDPRKGLTRLRGRLWELKYGSPAERTKAMVEAGSFTLRGAIKKTEDKIAELEAAAFQTRTRDTLYTALVVTGVAAGGMLAVWFATNAYSKLQEGRIRQAELKRLQR